MVSGASLKLIVADFFSPPHFGETPKISKWRVFAFAIAPLLIGAGLAFALPVIEPSYQGTFFQIFALVATVFTAMMPIVQSVAQRREIQSKYTKAEAAVWKDETNRLDVLRSLYSALTWAVILTVSSSIPLLLLQVEQLPDVARRVIAGVIYAIAASVAFIFLDVVTGIYLLLADETRAMESKLRQSEPHER